MTKMMIAADCCCKKLIEWRRYKKCRGTMLLLLARTLLLLLLLLSWQRRQSVDSIHVLAITSTVHAFVPAYFWSNNRIKGRKRISRQSTTPSLPISSLCGAFDSDAIDAATSTTSTDSTSIISTTSTGSSLSSSSPQLLSILHQTIQQLIDRRGRARWDGDYATADALKEQLYKLELPLHYRLAVEDLPRSQGGGSTWKLEYTLLEEEDSTATAAKSSSANNSTNATTTASILQLAHRALGLAVSCSQRMVPAAEKQAQLQPIVQHAKQMLQDWNDVQEQRLMLHHHSSNDKEKKTSSSSPLLPIFEEEAAILSSSTTQTYHWRLVETTLRGRKAADAAFWFALAGSSTMDDMELLLDLLQRVCVKELRRFGNKPTCRSKDILQMMDRFAVAGLREAPELEAVARECLRSKGEAIDDDDMRLLDLHSDRTLLMLWKFSARQKKQQSFLRLAKKHWEISHTENGVRTNSINKKIAATSGTSQSMTDWNDVFSDPCKPLVVDIGCGMGISLLGLANSNASFQDDTLSDCNMLGVDLSGLTIGYAQGMAHRWKMSHRLNFQVESAENVLQNVIDSYPGVVRLCLIQFPTPYQLAKDDYKESSGSGNSQLPSSAQDGFMVSAKLLQLVYKALCLHDHVHGRLLLQSNCEDVAVHMRDTAVEQTNFVEQEVPIPILEAETHPNLPQRTLNWLEIGGVDRRAVGPFWSKTSLLPPRASTETEVACRLNQVPIHRCLLKVVDSER